MTLLLTEGFDWLETADLPNAYGAMGNYQTDGSMTETIEEAGGRNGDKSLKIIPGIHGTDGFYYTMQGKSFPLGVAPGAEVIFGFAVKFDTIQDSGNISFAGIMSGHIALAQNFNLNLVRLSGGTIGAGFAAVSAYAGGTGTTALNAGIWYYIECKFVSDNSTGAVEVKVNGNTEFTLTSLDTNQGLDNNVALVLGSNIPAVTIPAIQFDDLYICDDQGSLNNTYLGDVQVKMLAPDGNGNTSDFTGSDADSTDNYLHVDDGAAPDDDSSYVEDSTSANKDLYTYENLPAAAADVKAVAVKTIGKKVDVGAPDLLAVVRSNVTETDSSNLGMGVDYLARQAIYEVDPNTASAWGTAGVDAMEAGVKIE